MADPVCFECGKPAHHDHHVVPRSRGGTRTVPLCERCHGLVHDQDMTDHGTLTSLAMQAKRKRGEYTGGKAPWGWSTARSGGLEPNVLEQSIREEARGLRMQGLSLARIGLVLEERGLRSRSGKPFAAAQVARMVRG